jgi:hypothetical protein
MLDCQRVVAFLCCPSGSSPCAISKQTLLIGYGRHLRAAFI